MRHEAGVIFVSALTELQADWKLEGGEKTACAEEIGAPECSSYGNGNLNEDSVILLLFKELFPTPAPRCGALHLH